MVHQLCTVALDMGMDSGLPGDACVHVHLLDWPHRDSLEEEIVNDVQRVLARADKLFKRFVESLNRKVKP